MSSFKIWKISHYFYNKPARIKKSRLLLSSFLPAAFRKSTVVVCIASLMCFHSCVLLCITIIAKERVFLSLHRCQVVTLVDFLNYIVSSLQTQVIHYATELFKLAWHVFPLTFAFNKLCFVLILLLSIDQLTWLQEQRDPVQELFRWQTSPKMPQLIKWKHCLDSWVKLKKCTSFLSKIYTLSLLNIAFIIIPCKIYIKYKELSNSSTLFWLFQGSNDSPGYSYASLLC